MINKISLLLCLSICSGVSNADLITFQYSSTWSGSLGGVEFTDTSFNITAVGNTNNRVLSFSNIDTTVYYIDHDSVTITLSGIGTFDFITPTRTFYASVQNSTDSFGAGGFSHAGSSGLDLINQVNDRSHPAWDMLSSYEPENFLVAYMAAWQTTEVETNAGRLIFDFPLDNERVPLTFSATVVPVPAALWLFSSGIIGLIAIARKKKS